MKAGVDRLMRLDYCYGNGNVREKRMLLGSIFPEKMVFEEGRVRTARLNEVVQLIYAINKQLEGKKNGQRVKSNSLSSKVLSSIRISNLFMEDLRLLASK